MTAARGAAARRLVGLASLASLLPACEARPGTGRPGPRCRVGVTHTIAPATGLRIHALALIAMGDAPAALWSDARGLHARRLGALGEPEGGARRLGPPCEAGLAVVVAPGADTWVACLEAGLAAKDRPPWLRVLRLHPHGDVETLASAEAPGATGVAIAADPEGPPHVVWTKVGGVAWWRPGADAPRVSPRGAGAFPEAPTLAAAGGDRWAFWTERRAEGPWRPGVLTAARGSEAPVSLGDARGAPAGTAAAVHPAGGVVVAWRDRPDGWSTTRLWARRFDASLRPVGDLPVRVGRAGVDGPVVVSHCMGGFVTVAAHRDGSDSTSLGIRRLSADLAPLAPELAIYAQGVHFVPSAALCWKDETLLLLLGERGGPTRGGRLSATTYACR